MEGVLAADGGRIDFKHLNIDPVHAVLDLLQHGGRYLRRLLRLGLLLKLLYFSLNLNLLLMNLLLLNS